MMENLLKAVLTLLDKAVVGLVVLLVLPLFGVRLHWGVYAGFIVVVGAATYLSYRDICARTRRKPLGGIETLIGTRGRVVASLAPRGSIRIAGETWKASSVGREIGIGEEVVVTGSRGFMLEVEPVSAGDES